MGFNSGLLTTTAIALVFLGNPLAVMAATLTSTDQPILEEDPNFKEQVALFKADSDNFTLLLALSSSDSQQSPLSASLAMAYLFKGMTLAGNWQPETQVSFQDTPPQWGFQPTGWTSFR